MGVAVVGRSVEAPRGMGPGLSDTTVLGKYHQKPRKTVVFSGFPANSPKPYLNPEAFSKIDSFGHPDTPTGRLVDNR